MDEDTYEKVDSDDVDQYYEEGADDEVESDKKALTMKLHHRIT